MTTLGELRPGDVFRRGDDTLWLRHGYHDCRYATAMPLGAAGGGKLFHVDDPVEPLDLSALLKERDELLALTHDLLIDSEAYERGRQAERGEVMRLLEGAASEAQKQRDRERQHGDKTYARILTGVATTLEGVATTVRARGPAATPDPPARLAERVRELEGALRGLLDALLTHAGDAAYYTRALAPARAALTGAGGKQPT